MKTRQVALLVGEDQWLQNQLDHFLTTQHQQLFDKSAVFFYQENTSLLFQNESMSFIPFNKAKNKLGQECDCIIYDARYGLNLDTLAIASGTLKASGILLLVFNSWQNYSQQLDLDSQRWAGEEQSITTPNFRRFFQQKIQQFNFPIYFQDAHPKLDFVLKTTTRFQQEKTATEEQQKIIDEILNFESDLYIVTAKRGRGKSALAGLLSRHIQNLIVIAPNKSAVKILQEFSDKPLNFMAPDLLCEQLDKSPELFTEKFLIIDEAAMIPLPLLQQLTRHFKRILCTTTIQSYEGTGKGFLLKFMQKNDRTLQHFELINPLRWDLNDPLERFIDELLLLEAENQIGEFSVSQNDTCIIKNIDQKTLIETHHIEQLYGLLTLAHYRTSPLDLRRLFDAPQQHFHIADIKNHPVGCIWSLEEGNIQDPLLILDIQRGLRRPKGNMAAQILTQQTNLLEACQLTSRRISRIAVKPSYQNQGIGQRLIQHLAMDLATQNIDFISVSFGYTEALAHFWTLCGFKMVHVGDRKEASSGCYSVVAIKGLSENGKYFFHQALTEFKRNFPLSEHPLLTHFDFYKKDFSFQDQDRIILENFAHYHRTFASAWPSIQRLLLATGDKDISQLQEYKQQNSDLRNRLGHKNWLIQCRKEIKDLLQEYVAS